MMLILVRALTIMCLFARSGAFSKRTKPKLSTTGQLERGTIRWLRRALGDWRVAVAAGLLFGTIATLWDWASQPAARVSRASTLQQAVSQLK